MSERLEIIIQAKDKFSKQFGLLKNSLPSLRTAAIAASAAFAALGGAVVVASSKFIQLASDMEETTNKFNVVFRDQIDMARQWADEISESYFTSSEEARRFLSSVQDLLVPMGMNSKAAGKLSNEIVRLAADLGSFNNLPTERVILDMQSALVGNYETMKKYGVVLTATAVQQRALDDGLAKTKEELTTADKALTAYKIILESSHAAVGDMARSSESWANQMKLLRAQLTDIGTEIGRSLLEPASQYLKVLNQWVKANKDLIVLTTADWLRDVANMARGVGNALLWIDNNLTDKVLDFFLGPRDLSKLQILQTGLEKMQESLKKYKTQAEAAGRAGFIDEEYLQRLNNQIKLLEDSIVIRKEEVALLKERNKVIGEKPEAPEIGALPIIKPQAITFEPLPFVEPIKEDITALKALWAEYYKTEDQRLDDWLAGQREKYKGQSVALLYVQDVFEAKKQELRNSEAEAERLKLQQITDAYNAQFQTQSEQLAAWYIGQQELYAGHQESLAMIDEIYAARKAEIEEATAAKKEQLEQKAFSDSIAAFKTFGKAGFKIAQAFEIAQATMASYRAFTNTLATASQYFLPPIPMVMAGAALAAGLARVATIAAQKSPAAHGGLDYVPKEQTYLLDRGERVVSPAQNKDLTEFIKSGGGGFTIAGDLNLTVNAPSPVQDMDKDDWRDVTEDALIPALSELADRGIKPRT